MNKTKTWLNWSNVTTALLVGFLAAVLFIPAVKVFFIGAMMRIGIMRAPTQPTVDSAAPVDLSKITLRTTADSLITMDKFKGKVLIINFWATWCPPCRAEMPSINTLYQRYKNDPGVMILPVDADGQLQRSQSFMLTNGYELPVYALASALPPSLSFESIPTTIILDSNQRVVARHSGAANYADKRFYAFIDELIRSIK